MSDNVIATPVKAATHRDVGPVSIKAAMDLHVVTATLQKKGTSEALAIADEVLTLATRILRGEVK